jgi:hypothetical protein
MGEVQREIIYESSCSLCDEHKTERGVLASIKKLVMEDFCELNNVDQLKLIISMYEQYKLDRRTEKIQDYKKVNIKNINNKA